MSDQLIPAFADAINAVAVLATMLTTVDDFTDKHPEWLQKAKDTTK